MTCSASEVFCDRLTVTYKPDTAGEEPNSPSDEVMEFLKSSLMVAMEYGKDQVLLRLLSMTHEGTKPTTGTLLIKQNRNCTIISISGRFLRELRERRLYGEYLNLLSVKPHTVTWIDASRDYYTDAPKILKRLKRKHPRTIALTNKPVPTNWYMSYREDGQESGSFYGGFRTKARVTCAVYDKAKERYDKAGEIIPPTTRYEMRFRGRELGMTLKDAYDPTRLFWHYVKPLMIKPEQVVEPWEPHGEYMQWKGEKTEPMNDVMKLRKLLEYSTDVQQLIELVNRCGGYGHNLLHAKLEADQQARVGRSPRMTEPGAQVELH